MFSNNTGYSSNMIILKHSFFPYDKNMNTFVQLSSLSSASQKKGSLVKKCADFVSQLHIDPIDPIETP